VNLVESVTRKAKQYDPYAPEADGTIPVAAVELQASMDIVGAALQARVAAMPARSERSVDDLPPLPELQFETEGKVEATILTAMQTDLATGRTAAEQLFTDQQPEVAIERVHQALDQVRQRLDSMKTTPAWKADCVKQIDETTAALSEQLAGPYLAALNTAASDAYLATNEADRTAKWGHVMDLLEALVQLAPKTEKLTPQFKEIDEYLYSQERLDSLEAAVARERFETIRQLLTPGASRRRTGSRVPQNAGTSDVNGPRSGERGYVGGQVHGVELTARQAAQNALAQAGQRYLELDAQIRQLLLRFKPGADAVQAAERNRTAALDDVRRLLAARDREDSRVYLALEEKIGERRAARAHFTDSLGLRDDADEVKQVGQQIAAIQQAQAGFQTAHARATGRGPDVDLQAFLRDPRNLVAGEVNSIGMLMVRIPKGQFTMGSPAREEDRDDDENQVPVTISQDFLMSAHEVTVGQVLQWLNDPATKFDSDWIDLDSYACPVKRSGNRFVLRRGSCKFGQSEDQPMVEISWTGATKFAEWLSGKEGRTYRLPTEAEWEYACRAGTTTRYYWGDRDEDADQYAWHGGNSNGATHPVGQKQPNAWGLYDMSGSLWEFCSDWYDDELAGGTDPRGPSSASDRVLRGGSWGSSVGGGFLRSADRDWYSPGYRFDNLGFRVACSSVKG
jgi:formylglycine-generating enzyme required for sulfatase activity